MSGVEKQLRALLARWNADADAYAQEAAECRAANQPRIAVHQDIRRGVLVGCALDLLMVVEALAADRRDATHEDIRPSDLTVLLWLHDPSEHPAPPRTQDIVDNHARLVKQGLIESRLGEGGFRVTEAGRMMIARMQRPPS